jgi:hypothetical protein
LLLKGLNQLTSDSWYVNWTWTASDSQIGENLIVVSATDSGFLNTQQKYYVTILLPELNLNLTSCDLRTKNNCDQISGFGDFLTSETIYTKIQLIEVCIFFAIYSVTDVNSHINELKKKYANNKSRTIDDYASFKPNKTLNNQVELSIQLRRLAELGLYENVKFGSARKLDASEALVKIFVSYSNSSFVQHSSIILYDSKCRSVNAGGSSFLIKVDST